METDAKGSPDGDLTHVERHLLTQKGYTVLEIDVIERSILGCPRPEDEHSLANSRLMEPADGEPAAAVRLHSLWSERLLTLTSAANSEDAVAHAEDAFEEYQDDFTEADDLREVEGLAGVLRKYLEYFVDVENTYYTFRDWRQIRQACLEMELTPLPSQEEIESACGPGGLDLPSTAIDGSRYFDFEFVAKNDAAKALCARELTQAREEVHRYLIGRRFERWE